LTRQQALFKLAQKKFFLVIPALRVAQGLKAAQALQATKDLKESKVQQDK
jgi:hypothetical protein